jgi:hypothetical protein
MTILDLFHCFRHVKEAGQNTGARVEAIQKWGGGKAGDSWCCWLVTMVLDMYYCGYLGQEKAPIPRLGSCDDVLHLCMQNGWLVDKPTNDGIYIYFFVRKPDGITAIQMDAHHIGMVASARDTDFNGISGNTSEDGKSSNGNGCYERGLTYSPRIKFAKVPS